MSDEGEIDVESDEVGEGADGLEEVRDSSGKGIDKRAHHNALERKRRDHIKDSFTNLRDCIPSLSGEKVSRAHVLNKATEYIRQMQRNSSVRTVEIDELRKKNEILEEQVNGLEQAQERGTLSSPEELIASIAEKVQQRQLQRQQQQQQQEVNTNKTNKVQLEPSSESSNSKEKTAESGEQSNSFNILANNIRTTQNILTALAKNLPPNSSNSQQMRAIAARLASPARPQGAASTTLPRGVVTATTVPQLLDQLPKTTPPLTNDTSVVRPVVATPTSDTSVASVHNNNNNITVNSDDTSSMTVNDATSHNEPSLRGDQTPPSKRIKTDS